MTENLGQNDAQNESASEAPTTLNPLEEALAKGQTGEMEQTDVILAFLNSNVLLLSAKDPEQDPEANLEPIALESPDGQPMIAVFSEMSRVPAEVGEQAPYGITVQGATVVNSVTENTGIMLNPGFELGFMIEPSGVQMIRNDFRPAAEVDAMNAEAGQNGPAGQTGGGSDEAHPVRPTNDPAGF